MRHISSGGLELIKHHEGFVPVTYICPAGYPTIGFGHLLKPGEHFAELTLEQGEALLKQDVQSAERAVLRHIQVPLSDNEFDALVSFTFNLGSGALQSSTLRRKLNRGEYDVVPAQLRRWVWAKGKRLKGLIRRRHDEALWFQGVPLHA